MNLNYNVKKNEKIVIFGHKGLIGSALLREFKLRGYKKILTVNKEKLNLLNLNKVKYFFKKNKPKLVILAAARVGGIYANNSYPFNFLYENMIIQNNLITCAIKFSCKRFIFLGSSCIYPRYWKKPFNEKDLNLSNLEKTNESYAIAKISGLKLCENYNRQFNNRLPNFITVIPPNLFGPNDNYDEKNSHVLAALMRKFFLAKAKNLKKIEIWGSGKPRREFLYSEDAAKIISDLMEIPLKKIYKHTKGNFSHINIGPGVDYNIKTIVQIIKKISKYKGKILYNKKFPDGVKRKLLDVSLLKKISPKSFDNNLRKKKDFEQKIKKVYDKLEIKTFKKNKKNYSLNLSI